MKLLRTEKEHYIFELATRERELLKLVLTLYPVIPPAHQRVSKSSGPANKENQRLLDDALAEHRKENKKLVGAFLADSSRFQEVETVSHMRLTSAEVEWLLQILNDVRVGNWILLGSPEEELPRLDSQDPNAPHLWAMELAGVFQMQLLDAMRM